MEVGGGVTWSKKPPPSSHVIRIRVSFARFELSTAFTVPVENPMPWVSVVP